MKSSGLEHQSIHRWIGVTEALLEPLVIFLQSCYNPRRGALVQAAIDILTSRNERWQRAADIVYDILVIGGGITGAGIARDAALRGLKVALVEQGDFASGTSSKSSKLLHGGLRYLEQFQFGMVLESVRERDTLTELAPHLVHPLSFLVPLYHGKSPGRFLLHSGLCLYEMFSQHRSYRHQMLHAEDVLRLEPVVNAEKLYGGATYVDQQTDDVRLTIENLIDARSHGADVYSYARLVSADPISSSMVTSDPNLRFVATMMDMDAKVERTICAKMLVYAVGAWAHQTDFPSIEKSSNFLRLSKGAHIVLDAKRLSVTHAVVMKSSRDGRVVYALPWNDPWMPSFSRTVIGTTDTDFEGNPAEVWPDKQDVEYLLSCANEYFPSVGLTNEDVFSAWAGLRPLSDPSHRVSSYKASRDYRISESPGRLSISGGKLTTYRTMAEHLVDRALLQLGKTKREHPCSTKKIPFPGSFPDDAPTFELFIQKLQSRMIPSPISAKRLAHWVSMYGSRTEQLLASLSEYPQGWEEDVSPAVPSCMAQVDFAVREEMALRLSDVMIRRFPWFMRLKDQGVSFADRVAMRMALHLGWSRETCAAEVRAYSDEVEASRTWAQP